jgi:UPF0271 protein
MNLEDGEIEEQIISQLTVISQIANYLGTKLHHVKPHGALYNMSARDKRIARVVANTVKNFDGSLVLYGLSGSHSVTEGKNEGLKVAEEGFADRRYNDDGSLVSRQLPLALINDVPEAVEQAVLLSAGKVRTIGKRMLHMHVDTICIHGDGSMAVAFAKAIREVFKTDKPASPSI